MNKTAKWIVVGGVTLVLMGGGLAALKLTAPNDGADASSLATDAVESTALWQSDVANISKINIQLQNEAYEVDRLEEREVAEDGTETINYEMKEFTDLPVDGILLRTPANCGATMETTKNVEEHASDLDKYGLKNPVSTTRITFDDGTTQEFCVGNESPISGQTYFCMKDSDTVYTVSSMDVAPYIRKPEEYLSKTVEEELADDSKLIVKSVNIARKDLPYEMRMEYDSFYANLENGGTSAAHVMKTPVVCNLNVDKSSSVTNGIFGLTAKEIIKAHPDETAFKLAGLDDPFCTVTIVTDDGVTRVLKLGNTYSLENDETVYYYGYLEGRDMIYGFDTESASWATVMPADITSKLIMTTYVWDVGKLTVSAQGRDTMTFEGKGSSKEDYVLKFNGEDADIERYRQFYVFLLKTSAEDLCLDGQTVSGEPIASIKLERQDGLKTQTVEFYEAEGRKVYIVVDGVCSFMCRRAYVDTLMDNMARYETSEDFVTNW